MVFLTDGMSSTDSVIEGWRKHRGEEEEGEKHNNKGCNSSSKQVAEQMVIIWNDPFGCYIQP